MHLVALHHVGSNNPDGIDIKKLKDKNGVPLDGIEFHPYYTVHDMVGIVVFFICFAAVIFFFPEGGGFFLEPPNFEAANALKTPAHIAPVWYYTPFYAILRAVPDKLGGVVAMGGAIAVLFLVPWLDRSPVRSMRYKGILSKIALTVFAISFLVLGYLGATPTSPTAVIMARVFTVLYFLFFLLMPIYTSIEKCKQPPERVTGGH